jgi:hypothetical protein
MLTRQATPLTSIRLNHLSLKEFCQKKGTGCFPNYMKTYLFIVVNEVFVPLPLATHLPEVVTVNSLVCILPILVF